MKNKHRHSNFDLEALEPRILLSADGADLLIPGAPEAVEVVMTSANEQQPPLPETIALAGDALYPVIEGRDLIVNAGGVFDSEGRQLATELAGLHLAADSVVIADGVEAGDWQIDAASIYMGEVHWVGGSVLNSDALSLSGTQSGAEGSSLTLAPRRKDAAISLGAEAEGFSLDSDALDYLSGSGLGELIIGQADGSHVFTIDGLDYVGNLTLRAPEMGGHFYVQSEIRHSGGALTYLGSGHTQDISGDTITTGVPINVNDTLNLVENPLVTKTHGPNTILLDTTAGGNTAGANILITGSILGTGVGEGGVLYLNAGTGGDIRIDGDVGTTDPLDGLIILNARNVIFNGNILTNFITQQAGTGNTIFGNETSDTLALKVGDLDITTENNITFTGDVTITEGDIDLTVNPASAGTGKIHFKQSVTLQDGDILIQSARNVEFTHAVDIEGSLTQIVGTQATLIRGEVDADSIDLTSNLEIRFEDEVRLAVGDMTLTSNDVNFTGGSASIIGALDNNNLPLSHLTLRPVDNTVSMDIGSPVGGVGTFQFTTTDIAALADGFDQLTFGYPAGSTNAVRIGNAIFLDPVDVFGGSALVNGTFNAKADLTVEAASGGIEVTNTQVRVGNDQIDSVWQSAAITFAALQGDITFTNGGSLRVLNQDDDDLSQGSLITLTAQNGSIINVPGSEGFMTARDLIATATGDIVLLTEIKNLTAHSTVEGDINLVELDDLHVISAITADGSITINTGGDTTLDYLSSVTDHADNFITVDVFSGSLTVGQVLAGTLGDVSLSAEGALTGFTLQTLPHVAGNVLTLSAIEGIGESGNPLLILANHVDVTNTDSGSVVLSQLTGRSGLTASVINDAAGSADHISLNVDGGNTVVGSTGIHSAADAGIRIHVAEDLRFDGDVSGSGGALTAVAGGAGELTAGVMLASGGGDVLMQIGGMFTQAADASVLSGGGHLSLLVTDDILLGTLDTRHFATPADQSTSGNASVVSTNGFVHDTAASATVNVFANELTLRANTGLGELDETTERALETEVALLAAVTVSGSIALKDQNDLSTGTTSAFTLTLLNEDGSTTTSGLISGLTAVNNNVGDIMLSAEGLLTLSTADAVETDGASVIALFGGSVSVEGAVRSAGGNLFVKAATGNISLLDAGHLISIGNAVITLEAEAGAVLASAGNIMDADLGDIHIAALGNVTLGQLNADAQVDIASINGSVRAAAGGIDTRTVITSAELALFAGVGINGPQGSTEALLTAVDKLALGGSGDDAFRIENTGSLLLDDISLSRVSYSTLLALTTTPGVITGGFVTSGEGDLELIVNGDLDIAALKRMETTGAGDISVTATGGFTMAVSSLVINVNGNIEIVAEDSVALAAVSSADGDITLRSNAGSIVDNDPAEALVDINTLGQIDLIAETGVGVESGERQTLNILADSLSAETATGGIFIHSAASFATSGLVSTGGATPISVLSDMNLDVGPNSGGVAVDASGDLVLTAGGDLTQLSGGAISAAADIRLSSAGTLTLVEVMTPGDVALTALVVTGLPATTATEITANGLLLDTVGVFGSPAQFLRTSIAGLAGTVTAGRLAFANGRDLSLTPVSVETTATSPMGALPVTPFVQSGNRLVVNGSGEGLFADIDGSLTVDADTGAALTVAEAIPVLWQTSGTQSWNDAFALGGGDSTFRSASHLSFFDGGISTTGNGDIYLEAGGDLNFATTSGINSGSGSLLADVANVILVNGALSSTASVGLLAGREISVTAIGGPAVRVTARELILNAGYKITSGLFPLTTDAQRISARSGAGGVYVANNGNLLITNTGFAVASLQADASVEVAFSGHQGGVTTTQAGAIGVNSTGTITVHEVAAVIEAFPDTANAISIVADGLGPDGNALNILFDIVTSGSGGNPPTTVYTPETGLLTVTLRRDVSTLQEIVDAINADPDFAGTAVLAAGPMDGSLIFTLPTDADFAFFAEGGRREGVLVQSSGTLTGGAEAIAAVSQILLPGESYNIRFTSLNPGAAANAFEVRLLDDGPGGNLTDGANAALVDWDAGAGQLNLYINFGATTVGTLLAAVNAARDNDSLPFTAELNGSFLSSDLDDVLGDAGVTLQSNLSANAQLRPTGTNNDINVVSAIAGQLYNQISFRFVDDGSVSTLGVRASFDDNTNVLTVYLQSGITTANQVVSALNTEGTFTASLLQEISGGVNSGAGSIQAHHFALHSGAVGVNAFANMTMSGVDNDLILTADIAGADQNGITILLVEDPGLAVGQAGALYTAGTRTLEVKLNPSFATAGNVLTAINTAAAGILTATLAPANSGFGGIELASYPQTAGGTGGPPEAIYVAGGLNNDFELVADDTLPEYENIQVFITDDGSITDGTATATYNAVPRHLILNVQSGVTTLNDLLAVLNADADIPVSGSLLAGNDGSGVFNLPARSFIGGVDAVKAAAATLLPSGVEIVLEADVGGIAENGIQVVYAINQSLPPNTAAAQYFEVDDVRLLQIQVQSAGTTLDKIDQALTAAALPFSVANLGTVGSLTAGGLALRASTVQEGNLRLSANGDISLIGRVQSQTGPVTLSTPVTGDLTFDSETARVVAISSADINLAGSFANLSSLENPLVRVYENGPISLIAGANTLASELPVNLLSGGNITIGGDGALTLNDQDLNAEAGGDIVISGPVDAGTGNITLTAIEGVAITTDGSISGEDLDLEAGDDILQNGNLTATGTGSISLTSTAGAITMGADAETISDSGTISYTADSDIAITSIASITGNIDLTSGGTISDTHVANGTNLATGGVTALTARTGIGATGTGDLKTRVGDLQLRNLGVSGDIVITEEAAGGDLRITELTQDAVSGWSVISVDNGSLTFSGAVTHSDDGSLVLGVNGNLLVQETIHLQGGDLSAGVFGNVTLGKDVNSHGGDVGFAAGGVISMNPAMTLDSDAGNVLLQATDNILVSTVLSEADVRIESTTASVLRAANDGSTNVMAAQLQLEAHLSVGSLASEADALIIEVTRLNATASNGAIAIQELNDLAVGNSSVTVRFAQIDKSSVSGTWNESQFFTQAGAAVLQVDGSLTIETISAGATVEVDGNLLIAAGADLTLNGDLQIMNGSAQLMSQADTLITGSLDVDGRSLLMNSGGLFTMDPAAVITVVDDHAVLTSVDVMTLSRVDTGSGDLALRSDADLLVDPAAPVLRLSSSGLRLEAGGTIGSVADPINLTADTLSALGMNGIHLNVTGDVDVNTVGVTVDTVNTLGFTTDPAFVEADQSDLESSAAGNILVKVSGLLEIHDGDADTLGVVTNGAGVICLETGTLDAFADIQTVDGDITINSAGVAHWVATAKVLSTNGDLHIVAGAALTMDDQSLFRSTNGSILVDSDGLLLLGSVQAANGLVAIDAAKIEDNGDTRIDIIADSLQLLSDAWIGQIGPYNAIDIDVNLLAARATAGGIALSELSEARVGAVSGSVAKVDLAGLPGTTAVSELFGLTSMAAAPISVTAAGSLTLLSNGSTTDTAHVVRAGLNSNIFLQSSTGRIIVQDAVSSDGGHVTMRGATGISLDADVPVSTNANGTLSLFSANGLIGQETGSSLSAVNGDIVLQAASNIYLAEIQTNARVAVTSTNGAILDNNVGALNVTAASLRLRAGLNIAVGSNPLNTSVGTMSARTMNGAMYLSEANGLTIAGNEALTQVVDANNVLTPTSVALQTGLTTGGVGGTIVVQTVLGALTVNAGNQVTASSAGNVLLSAQTALDINAIVSSGSGTVTLESQSDFSLAAGLQVSTSGAGQIHVLSGGALTTGAESRFVNATGNIGMVALGDITLGGISSTGRAVIASASGSVRGAGSTTFDFEVIANQLALYAEQGGVGTLSPVTPLSPFRTSVSRIAGTAGAGGLNLVNNLSVTVDLVTVSLQRVQVNGSLLALPAYNQVDLQTVAGNGSIVLQSTAGAVTLNEGGDTDGLAVSANGSGNVRIYAALTLTANVDVLSGSGHVTLRSVGNLLVNGDVTTSDTGDVYLRSDSGALTMAAAASATAGANMFLRASNDLTLGNLFAMRAAVTSVNGKVLNVAAAGESFTGTHLRLEAQGDIGSAMTALQIEAQTVSAVSNGGGIYLDAADDIAVGQVGFSVQEVLNSAATTPVVIADLTGLRSTANNGNIILTADAGTVTINNPVIAHGSGNILLSGNDQLTLTVDITSTTGNISLISANGTGITLQAGVDVSTTGTASVYIDAGVGSFDMHATSTISVPGGSLRVAADGELTLGSLSASKISLISRLGGIRQSVGSGVTLNGGALRISAEGRVGTIVLPLDISVESLAAVSATGDLFFREVNGVTVTGVAVTTSRVGSDAGTTPITDSELSDLSTGLNGDIHLVTLAGSIILNDGGDEDFLAVDAHGTGAVRLNAAVNLLVNSGIVSDTGDITLLAESNITMSGVITISTAAPASVFMATNTGAVTMTGFTMVSATESNIRVSGFGDVSLGNLSGEELSILSSAGSILNAPNSSRNLTGSRLRLQSFNGTGTDSRFLTTAVDTISGVSTQGTIRISNHGDSTIGTVGVITQTAADAALTGLATTTGGDIVLLSTGKITVEDPVVSVANVRLSSGSDLVLGDVQGVKVSLLSAQNIVNPLGDSPNVAADALRIYAVGDVGTLLAPLTTNAGLLSAGSAGGELFISSAGDMILGSVSVAAAGVTDASTHGLYTSGGNITATSPGKILDGGDALDDVRTTGRATLIAVSGMGSSGNELNVRAGTLVISNTGNGSVYLNLTVLTTIQDIHLDAGGYLYLNAAGGVTQSGLISIAEGSAILNITNGFSSSAAFTVNRDLRIQAKSITLNTGAALTAGTKNVLLRSESFLNMAAGTSIDANQGDVMIQTATDAILGLVTAGRAIITDITGDLSGLSTSRLTHELNAPVLRLSVDGKIFPILTRSTRMDVRAGKVQEIYEFDDLTAGRYGFDLVAPNPGDEFVLKLNSATLASMAPVLRILDDVVFVIRSGGQINMATRVLTPAGDIRIEVNGFVVNPAIVGPVLQAPLGEVHFDSVTGTGSAGSFLIIDAAKFRAAAGSGNIAVRFASPVTISGAGVKLNGGAGHVTLIGDGGTTTLEGNVFNEGSGDIEVATMGGLRVNANAFSGPVIRGNRLLTLNLDEGTLFTGGNALAVSSANFWADTRTGSLWINMTRGTRIETHGLRIREGSGDLIFRVMSGNLTMAAYAQIRNVGQGSVNIRVEAGAFTMGTTNTVSNQNNQLLIFAWNTFTIGHLVSRGTLMNVRSEAGDLIGLDMVNLVIGSSHIPQLSVNAGHSIKLKVDGPSVLVNGNLRTRSGEFLYINVTF
ncbi:MAG: LEPR-XLL domain-containing protein [Kiritimatiellia bacterium]